MKLHDHLLAAGSAVPAPTRKVTFKVLGYGPGDQRVVAQVTADLAFVDEKVRKEALREANVKLAVEYNGEPIPEDRRADEENYHVLHRALRDTDDVRSPFARSVVELQSALVLKEARKLWSEYVQFVEEEFPDEIDAETFKAMVEDARKKCLPDLVSTFGFETVRRGVSGLVAIFAKSPTPTSGAGAPV